MFVFLFFHMTLSTYPKTMEVDGRPLYFKSIVDRREMFKAIFKPISQRAHKVVFQQRAPTEGSYRLWLYGVVGTKRDLKLHTSCLIRLSYLLLTGQTQTICLLKKKKKKKIRTKFIGQLYVHAYKKFNPSCQLLHLLTCNDINRYTALIVSESDFTIQHYMHFMYKRR